MNNKTAHWIFVALTGLVGAVQWATPFIPPAAAGPVIAAVAGINALVHVFFPVGDPAGTAPK